MHTHVLYRRHLQVGVWQGTMNLDWDLDGSLSRDLMLTNKHLG